MSIREKKHRLPEQAYWGAKTVSFTACVLDRRPLFTKSALVDAFVESLVEWSNDTKCIVPLYCFMPDHLHALVAGLEEESRPKRCFDGFKQATSNWLVDNDPDYHWQKDYHDHIIRKSVDWKAHAAYILLNPVRAKLVEDPFKYPFTGSIGCKLEDVFGELM